MTMKRQRSDRVGRKKLTSPGRPLVARSEDLIGFWANFLRVTTTSSSGNNFCRECALGLIDERRCI